MPLTQLLERLRSGPAQSIDRSSSEVVPPPSHTLHTSNSRQQASMECSFEVVAEIVPRSPGSASGSLCSVAADEPTAPVSQQQQPHQPAESALGRCRSQPAVVQGARQVTRSVSLSSGPLPSVSGLAPTTTRALRARGKAMLRTESGLPSMEYAHSLDSNGSSTMDLAGALWGGPGAAAPGSLAAAAAPGSALQPQSPTAKQAASAPLPAPAFVQQQDDDELLAARASSSATPAVAVAAAAAAAAGGLQQLQVVEDDGDEDDGDDDMLVHPMSPSAVMAEDEEHDAAAHCHWEDGVVATWLQDIDHSELLHAAAPPAAAAEPRAGSAIYTSLLYT